MLATSGQSAQFELTKHWPIAVRALLHGAVRRDRGPRSSARGRCSCGASRRAARPGRGAALIGLVGSSPPAVGEVAHLEEVAVLLLRPRGHDDVVRLELEPLALGRGRELIRVGGQRRGRRRAARRAPDERQRDEEQREPEQRTKRVRPAAARARPSRSVQSILHEAWGGTAIMVGTNAGNAPRRSS